ncbi:uncharacterized protein CEXT_715001 [Caerostris extrusa]|uniref:Uncharacterized protein n=1 Tax=Caerostris extrusa TaxID=172846 RepID=A0AAV4N555_CAEEX|nr:uncharacterized protein CEXT_715001 [Caerostris extrusa]
MSVRRRLPLDGITPESKSNSSSLTVLSPQHDLLTGALDGKRTSPSLEIPISPIKKRTDCPQFGGNFNSSGEKTELLQRRASYYQTGKTSDTKESGNVNGTLQRRISCLQSPTDQENLMVDKLKNSIQLYINSEKRSPEIPKSENRLHPSSSNTDIPFVDSEADVSFDDRRFRRLQKQRQTLTKSSKSTADVSFQEEVCEQKASSAPYITTIHLDIVSDAKTLSLSEPCISNKRKPSPFSPMEEEENKSLENDYMKPSLNYDDLKIPMSPMEEEENKSLNQHPKHLFTPDDSTVTFSPYS